MHKHHEHHWPPHLPSQHPIVRLKSGRPSCLAHSKSNTFRGPWTPSKSLDLFTHICPPFPYLKGGGKHHDHHWPPHLPSEHHIVRLKSVRSIQLPGSLQMLRIIKHRPAILFTYQPSSRSCCVPKREKRRRNTRDLHYTLDSALSFF